MYMFLIFLLPSVDSRSEILVKMSPFKVLLLLLVFCMFEKAVSESCGILREEEKKILHKGEQ